MNIVVTIKQVPDTTDVRLDQATGVLQRDRAKGMTNPEDKYALEMAIGLKEKLGGKVTVLSLGPETAKDSLKEALAMGADEAYLVSDAAAKGSDAVTTARVLAAAIDKIGPADLVLTGRRSIDGWTGAIAPMLAEALKLPLISGVHKLDVNASQLVAEQDWDESVRVVESSLPAVASVTREAKSPRLATAMGIMKAAKKPLTTWSLAEVDLAPEAVGLVGSSTKVVQITPAERKKKRAQIFEGASAATLSELNQKLAGRGLL